jgi:hypothetical protein
MQASQKLAGARVNDETDLDEWRNQQGGSSRTVVRALPWGGTSKGWIAWPSTGLSAGVRQCQQ